MAWRRSTASRRTSRACWSIRSAGALTGNVTASDRVDIRSDGSLTGDVIAARISIEDGAFFKGGIDIRKGGQQSAKANGEDKTAVSSSEPAAVGARA